MISGLSHNTLRDTSKYPCGVCRKGVGSNSIFCNDCKHWVHKKCTNIRGRLSAVPNFICDRCLGLARPIVGKPHNHVAIGTNELDTVDSFCYLGDNLCAGGGCELATITRTRSAWKKYREILPLLSARCVSWCIRG